MMTLHPLALYRLALLVMVIVIGYLGTTSEALPAAVDVSDKLLHGLAYCVLLLLADCSWPDSGLTPAKLLAVFAYGVLIEAVQYFLPWRDFSLADMLANALGMGFYVLLVPLLRRLPLLGLRRGP